MILLRIAFRNILATPVRTIIIGLLVVFGTTLVVIGGSLLSTLDRSMARSVVGSVTGHLQIYSADARDPLEMFNPPVGTPDLGLIQDFPRAKKLIEQVEGVETVIPMGTDFAMVFSGNLLDIKFSELRAALDEGDSQEIDALISHIRRIVAMLQENLGNLDGFTRTGAIEKDSLIDPKALATVADDGFWQELRRDPAPALELLENKIAPLAMDEKMLFLRYIGTDTEAFRKRFGLLEIVKGEMIPPGQRGFLFGDQMYERQVKHPVASRLDRVKQNIEDGRRIADDPKMQTRIRQSVRQVNEIVLQLDDRASREVHDALQEHLGHDGELAELLADFLDMDDENFAERYALFYEIIAPRITLYKVRMGDVLTIRSFTRSGYPTAVNVKVYGTYRFKGLEKSMLAGVYNLMDLMTYRDLYGYLTDERKEEIKGIKQDAGIERVGRDEAEAALFGGEAEVVEEVNNAAFDEFEGIDMSEGGQRYTDELLQRVYTSEEMNDGVVIHAAIILKDLSLVQPVKEAIAKLIKDEDLPLQVVDWRDASGMVGKFIGVIWIVLVTAIGIIFLVALVIINNSMVMATLDRTREIGSMRAMGAQRGYILRMLMAESAVLGFGFGGLGVALGAGIIMLLNAVGIPAFTDELYFLFAGSSLHPILLPGHFIVAFSVVFIVVLASTIAPARLAARITPVQAMQKED